jgi:hypothetical protein
MDDSKKAYRDAEVDTEAAWRQSDGTRAWPTRSAMRAMSSTGRPATSATT